MVKAKDLTLPFSKELRRILIQDQMWFFPRYTHDPSFVFPGWSAIFQNDNPVCIEYCSGNGTWIVDRAEKNPHQNFLAVELRLDRAKKIWARAKNHNLSNILVAWGEGLLLTKSYIPSHSIEAIFVNFPDPWPKKRHAKHRLIQAPFIDESFRILQKNKALTIVTDDTDYATQVQEEFKNHSGFTNMLGCIETPTSYGTSFFDQLFREQQKTIWMQQYIKGTQ